MEGKDVTLWGGGKLDKGEKKVKGEMLFVESLGMG